MSSHKPTEHRKEQSLLRRVMVELELLVESLRCQLQALQSALSRFAGMGKLHRKAMRLFLVSLERTRIAQFHQLNGYGFADGAHLPGSNMRRIDRNRHRK